MRKGFAAVLLTSVAILFGFAPAHAVMFSTPDGATEAGGNPVAASADLTLGAGTMSVEIQNLLADPKTVAQNVIALFFTVGGANGLATIGSSNAIFINVAGDGTWSYANPSSGSMGWTLAQSPDFVDFHLNGLGTDAAGPAHTI